jgi:hypothetical protein
MQRRDGDLPSQPFFATDDGEPVPEVHVEAIASHMVIMTMAINPPERKPSVKARLRKRVRRELGDAFDLGRYHEAVSDHGSVTVKILPDLVRARLARPR